MKILAVLVCLLVVSSGQPDLRVYSEMEGPEPEVVAATASQSYLDPGSGARVSVTIVTPKVVQLRLKPQGQEKKKQHSVERQECMAWMEVPKAPTRLTRTTVNNLTIEPSAPEWRRVVVLDWDETAVTLLFLNGRGKNCYEPWEEPAP